MEYERINPKTTQSQVVHHPSSYGAYIGGGSQHVTTKPPNIYQQFQLPPQLVTRKKSDSTLHVGADAYTRRKFLINLNTTRLGSGFLPAYMGTTTHQLLLLLEIPAIFVCKSVSIPLERGKYGQLKLRGAFNSMLRYVLNIYWISMVVI